MKVLIIGAGAVGIGIGASLADSGVEVDFIARGETKKAIDAEGISRFGFFKNIAIQAGRVGTYENLKEVPRDAYNYVIIATKTVSNTETNVELANNVDCMKSDGCIVFMQNGMNYEEPYREYFDENMLYNSRVITGFLKVDKNVVKITAHSEPILIGSIFGYDNEVVAPLAEAINASGLPAQVSDNVLKAMWAKLIYNTTLNPLGAILKKTYGELAASDYAHSIMDILIEETFALIKVAGVEVDWPDADSYRNALYNELIPSTSAHRSSTLQDINACRKTEIDTLTGVLLYYASHFGVAAPMHSMIYSLIKAIEEDF